MVAGVNEVTYRWLDGIDASQEEWDRFDSILATRGWMSLNRKTSRIRIAERCGQLLGFHVFQMIPSAGPLWVAPRERGTEIAAQLADDMLSFFAEAAARGWIVVASSPVTAKFCEERGMHKVKSPVYTTEASVVDNRGGS
jgi:hypothetical protein